MLCGVVSKTVRASSGGKDTSWYPADNSIGRDILRNDRAGSHDSTISDVHSTKDCCSVADPDVTPDHDGAGLDALLSDRDIESFDAMISIADTHVIGDSCVLTDVDPVASVENAVGAAPAMWSEYYLSTSLERRMSSDDVMPL